MYHQYVVNGKGGQEIYKIFREEQHSIWQTLSKTSSQIISCKKIIFKKKFKNAEKLSKQCISLPTNPLLKIKDLKYVCDVINKFN